MSGTQAVLWGPVAANSKVTGCERTLAALGSGAGGHKSHTVKWSVLSRV